MARWRQEILLQVDDDQRGVLCHQPAVIGVVEGCCLDHLWLPAFKPQHRASQAFAVDDSGRVTSARVVRSSGDPDRDRAALTVPQGATVQAPPPDLGPRVRRTAPFVFSLRN
ncbi:energy transducer TonB [Mesorhizobium sp. M00.F.Ca.ET.186.01.1.1]|nr:energy transducer TonB [bacterium M00.F.Ca.ET.205.01.1.1]TGU55054.1 energy transducer TonB [bacterium M00.F.Ca.ET.152.01.1.1]TGV38961.1 energy transducer TonB [Mesorhizobium sp. M00.F.Ca.ET.186.01.1.1]TGZ44629.1 energy transducer TonB [bacterium M00.F.Ca.ET.162.01.1.1]